MKNKKIFSLAVGIILVIVAFSLLTSADSFSASSEKLNQIEENNKDNTSQSTSEQPLNGDKLVNKLDYGSKEPVESNVTKNVKLGKISIQVYYYNYYGGFSLPSIPARHTLITLESDDGTVQRTGITNFFGHATFRFLPTEHDYVIKVSTKTSQTIGENIVMDSNLKTNYAVIFLK